MFRRIRLGITPLLMVYSAFVQSLHFVKVDALNKSLDTKLNPLRLDLAGLQSLQEYKD